MYQIFEYPILFLNKSHPSITSPNSTKDATKKHFTMWSRMRASILLLVLVGVDAQASPPSWLSNETSTKVEHAQDSRFLIGLAITPQDLSRCERQLEEVAINGQVSREQYIIFLEDFSGRSLVFQEFDQLPLSLVSTFFTAACSVGRDCTGDNPTIPLDPIGISQALLTLFCSSIKRIAAIQIVIGIQYSIRYDDNLSGEEIFEGVGGNTIRSDLEEATQLVLLDHFGCELWTQRRTREHIIVQELQRRSELSPSIRGTGRRISSDTPAILQTEEGLPRCDYLVEAKIREIIDIRKYQCILIVAVSTSAHF